MSRKPIIGDVIHYQISFDKNGKTRALNAKIEGVSQVLTLAPQEKERKTAIPSRAKERLKWMAMAFLVKVNSNCMPQGI